MFLSIRELSTFKLTKDRLFQEYIGLVNLFNVIESIRNDNLDQRKGQKDKRTTGHTKTKKDQSVSVSFVKRTNWTKIYIKINKLKSLAHEIERIQLKPNIK